ncbi:hypothetical protein C8R45DRAFT_1102588 [Mycena sanguinolenta]|nr:hypothetical protein C8R45DRAFT_1102588 [Mycena sanguinolenta]
MRRFFQFLRRVGRSRTTPVGGKPSDTTEKEPSPNVAGKKSRPTVDTKTARTATNVLVFSLRALSTIAHGIPLTGALSGTIDSLLETTAPIKQTSVNAQGFAQLAARLERLTTILTRVAQEDPGKEQVIVQNLHKELDSMTTDLMAASARGKLDQFFNSVDNASILHKYNNALAQMIAKSTFTTVQDVTKSLRELENSKMQDSHLDNGPNVLNQYDVAGETGMTGGNGFTGGEGGEGAGPQLDMNPDERWTPGKISGGTGGSGGNGVERGGKGGTGKGPLINMRRGLGARFTAKKPQEGEEDPIL